MDNAQVMAALNTCRRKNKTSMAWLWLIFWVSVTFNCDVHSAYVNTNDNVSQSVTLFWH